MSDKKPNYAWKGTWLICKAVADLCYTVCVLLLAFGVCHLAYVIALDEVPVPKFLIRQLEAQAQAKGVELRIEGEKGIRLYPDGRIDIDRPVLRDPAFGAPIVEASHASIDLDLPSLIFGHVKINRITLANGQFLTPAIISPSGTTETIVDHIDLRFVPGRRDMEIEYLRGRFGDARLSATGSIPLSIFQLKTPQENKFELREFLIENLPKVWDARAQIEIAQDLSIHLHTQTDKAGNISLDARLFAESLNRDSWSLGPIALDLTLAKDQALALEARLAEIQNSKLEIQIPAAMATAAWPKLPTPKNFHPSTFQVSLPRVSRQQFEVANDLALKGSTASLARNLRSPQNATPAIDLDATLRLADQPWAIKASADLSNRTAFAALDGQLSNALLAHASKAAEQDLAPFADFPSKPDLALTARLGPDFELQLATLDLDAGPLVGMGTPFDRATAHATFDGTQFSAPKVSIRKDGQHGEIGIDYNLETKFRRFLVEGMLHPNHIDSWFEPWWASFWSDNFQIGPDGFYILMDSQGTFGIPDSLRITGHAFAIDFGARGEPMEYFRSDMYILLHYFDLYNAELIREEGYARGDVQIDMDRDPRDGIDKLAGLWIDGESTLDPEIGKTVLYEVEKEVTEILEPYTYTKIPYIKAKSSSIRHLDDFNYDIALQVRADAPLTYEDFPLQAVQASVSIDNELVFIPDLVATFGNGVLNAKAEIRDEDLIFDAKLSNADFGEALKSAVEYFEAQEDAPPEGYDSASMVEYGGKIDMEFSGAGIVGDFQSYIGEGSYQITEADLKKVHLFGIFGQVFEGNPLLDFSTVKLTDASGPIQAKERYILLEDLTIEGPRSVMDGSGYYDLEEEEMDIKMRLFPFRKSNMIHTRAIGLVLTPISAVFELSMTGELSDPQVRLFGNSRKIPELEGENRLSEKDVLTNTPLSRRTTPKSSRAF
ncbi:MAG: AsmA-like C-terminal region-containing protein [Verrucomicrobiota bacterium]